VTWYLKGKRQQTEFWCKSCMENRHKCTFQGKAHSWGISKLPELKVTVQGNARRKRNRDEQKESREKRKAAEELEERKAAKKLKEKKKLAGTSGGSTSWQPKTLQKGKVPNRILRPTGAGSSLCKPSSSGPSSSSSGAFTLTDLTIFDGVLSDQGSSAAALKQTLINIKGVQEQEQGILTGRTKWMDEIILDLKERLAEHQMKERTGSQNGETSEDRSDEED